MTIYTNPSELDDNELQPGDQVVIGWITGTITGTFINFGWEWSSSHSKHLDTCRLLDVRHVAYAVYSDQSDMSGNFPQYTNMRDAKKIAQELMRRNSITQPLHSNLPMLTVKDCLADDDRASCGSPMSATAAVIRAMKTWSSVSYSEKMMSAPVSEQKKSRIIFPKIR